MRPTKYEWAMQMALICATRSTCQRLHVGAILLDKDWRILSTGYNGAAKGLLHCDEACKTSETCDAIHAEQNALLQWRHGVPKTLVVTTAPCFNCTKLLLNTECDTIVFMDDHPKMGPSKDLWQYARRSWLKWGNREREIIPEPA